MQSIREAATSGEDGGVVFLGVSPKDLVDISTRQGKDGLSVRLFTSSLLGFLRTVMSSPQRQGMHVAGGTQSQTGNLELQADITRRPNASHKDSIQ